ncbi:hypothetical protein ACWJKU_10230 [Methylocaldum sp. MU1018]
MKHYILRAMLHFVAFSYDLWSYLADLPRLVFGRVINYEDLFQRIEEEGVERLAFVTPHPTNILRFSMRHLVEALLANNYIVVVAVAKEDTVAWLKEEFPQIHIVPREMRGRDFGVWKALILTLLSRQTLAKKVKNLMLVNDSLYFNKHTTALIERMTNCGKHWSCLYESYEPIYHAQSFLIMLDNVALNSTNFRNYWDSYLPFDSRRHTILKGEFGLSNALIKWGFLPFSVVTSRSLSQRIDEIGREDMIFLMAALLANAQIVMRYSEQLKRVGIFLGIMPENGRLLDKQDIPADWIKNVLSELLIKICELGNPTHTVGLAANQLLDAPVKRDLAYRGTHQIADILRLVRGYSEEELTAMSDDLRAKALPISIRGFKRILFAIGRA